MQSISNKSGSTRKNALNSFLQGLYSIQTASWVPLLKGGKWEDVEGV